MDGMSTGQAVGLYDGRIEMKKTRNDFECCGW